LPGYAKAYLHAKALQPHQVPFGLANDCVEDQGGQTLDLHPVAPDRLLGWVQQVRQNTSLLRDRMLLQARALIDIAGTANGFKSGSLSGG
jgi:hypothetical protein